MLLAGLCAVVLALFGLPLLLVLLVVGSSWPVGGNDGGSRDIPREALAAYAGASARAGSAVPDCTVPVWVLMAVGKVESNHAAGHSIGVRGGWSRSRRRVSSPEPCCASSDSEAEVASTRTQLGTWASSL